MAWIRSSLSMISFGFAPGKLKELLDIKIKRVLGRVHTVSVDPRTLLVILGTLALSTAAFQHWHRMRTLYQMGSPHQITVTFMLRWR